MIRIVTDSAADLTARDLEIPGVTVVPLGITFADGTAALDDGSMTKDEFFTRLAEDSKLPRTSQPSPASFIELFEEAADAGDEVIVITIAQKLSGTYQCANLAAAEAVLELRGSLPGLRLVAVVPFGGQEARFSHADRARYRAAMASADDAVVLSPVYRAGCYAVRNNYLVDHASLLVAWYDGSPGGTRHTVSRALRRGLEFVNLHPQRAGVALTEPTLF